MNTTIIDRIDAAIIAQIEYAWWSVPTWQRNEHHDVNSYFVNTVRAEEIEYEVNCRNYRLAQRNLANRPW
jgi:hypothetical protein